MYNVHNVCEQVGLFVGSLTLLPGLVPVFFCLTKKQLLNYNAEFRPVKEEPLLKPFIYLLQYLWTVI